MEIGEGVCITPPANEEEAGLFLLRFRLVDEECHGISGIPYKTVKAGESAEPLHIADGRTASDGKTSIVSTTENEEIDFYICWAKLTVNKGFLKM